MVEIETYLNRAGRNTTQQIHIDVDTTYIIDLNKFHGRHILNNAMKPETITAREDIVTKTSVVIGTKI